MSVRIMSIHIASFLLVAGSTVLPFEACAAQQTGDADGDRSGAIRSLGAAGYNDHRGKKPPAVTIPPLDEGPSGTSGTPRGTVSYGGSRRGKVKVHRRATRKYSN